MLTYLAKSKKKISFIEQKYLQIFLIRRCINIAFSSFETIETKQVTYLVLLFGIYFLKCIVV